MLLIAGPSRRRSGPHRSIGPARDARRRRAPPRPTRPPTPPRASPGPAAADAGGAPDRFCRASARRPPKVASRAHASLRPAGASRARLLRDYQRAGRRGGVQVRLRRAAGRLRGASRRGGGAARAGTLRSGGRRTPPAGRADRSLALARFPPAALAQCLRRGVRLTGRRARCRRPKAPMEARVHHGALYESTTSAAPGCVVLVRPGGPG